MDKVFIAIGAGLFAMLAIVISALVGGTIIWLVWPFAIPVIFPALVASGVIAGKITWVASVFFTWICAILIKSTSTSK